MGIIWGGGGIRNYFLYISSVASFCPCEVTLTDVSAPVADGEKHFGRSTKSGVEAVPTVFSSYFT
jgi:hypothetical protein